MTIPAIAAAAPRSPSPTLNAVVGARACRTPLTPNSAPPTIANTMTSRDAIEGVGGSCASSTEAAYAAQPDGRIQRDVAHANFIRAAEKITGMVLPIRGVVIGPGGGEARGPRIGVARDA